MSPLAPDRTNTITRAGVTQSMVSGRARTLVAASDVADSDTGREAEVSAKGSAPTVGGSERANYGIRVRAPPSQRPAQSLSWGGVYGRRLRQYPSHCSYCSGVSTSATTPAS